MRQRFPLLQFNIILEVLSGTIGQDRKKKKKGIQIEKEDVKLPSFADMILSTEN